MKHNKLWTILTAWAQRNRKASRRGQRGMSLVEIMVVVVIISMVAGVVGVAVFSALDNATKKTTLTQMQKISDALDLYRLNNRKYPGTAEGLGALTASKNGAPPIMKEVPKDGWGNEFVYVYPGQGGQDFDLVSYGPDGAAGGGDDLTHGQKLEE